MPAAIEPEQLKDKEESPEADQKNQPTGSEETDHENQVGRGYVKKSDQDSLSSIDFIKKKKKLFLGGGAVGGVAVIILIVFFGFLNVFKLDGIMSNIDINTFSRFNAAADRRSNKWIQSYFFLKLTQLKGLSDADPDSEYFRANKVDTNNPARDWYHTLSTSRFEKDLAQKGIVFVNRDASGPDGQKFTFSVLQVDGKEVAGLKAQDLRKGRLVDQLRTGNLSSTLQDEIDLSKPGANKEARQLIKQTVNDFAQTQNVLKRRQVRKAIQNMTGVRDWRFFETTRDKPSAKKIDIRNKLITKAIPESTLSGKFIRCFFGITGCQFSEDPVDPQYQANASLNGDNNPDNPDNYTTKDENGNSVTKHFVDLGPAADIFKQIINKANITLAELNVLQTLDSLSNVNSAIKNGELSKGVAVAKGIQAMGLYQVFETSRDQMKTGQLTGDEVNNFMKVIGPVASSEGWTKVISGQGDASQLTKTASATNYCQPKHQAELAKNTSKADEEFAYLCPDKQIGGSSNAGRLEDAYNSSIGKVLGPILSIYDKPRHAPIIGGIIGFAEGVINSLTGVLNSIAEGVLNVVGLGDNVQQAMQWIVEQVAGFLGAGPIPAFDNGGGGTMNWLVQGGAYTAETSARTDGASLTSSDSKAAAGLALSSYNEERQSSMSFFAKNLSLSNPNSLSSKSALAVSQWRVSNVTNYLTNITGMFKSSVSPIFSAVGHGALAASSNDGYGGAEFAGIQTFDFPKQCYDRDPLTATPQNGTNIQEVLGANKVPDSDLSWDLVDNSNDWYQYVYDKVGNGDNADKIAEKIYNCNLLDTAVRGSLGYVYGYTKDNGLNDNSDSSPSPSPEPGPTPPGDSQQLAQQILQSAKSGRVKFNVLDSSDRSDGSTPEQNIQEVASGKPAKTTSTCASSGRGAQAPNASVNLDLNLLKFIYELSQAQIIQINALAGQCHSSSSSNHYQGRAVDFGCPFDPSSANKIGTKYNISDQTGETCSNAAHYHYSIGGH